MDYRMISADDHLDLQYLPADPWTTRLPMSPRNCSIWPHSRRIVEKQMGRLSPEMCRPLTRDNAVALYGL
jgi:hypothetical protein